MRDAVALSTRETGTHIRAVKIKNVMTVCTPRTIRIPMATSNENIAETPRYG